MAALVRGGQPCSVLCLRHVPSHLALCQGAGFGGDCGGGVPVSGHCLRAGYLHRHEDSPEHLCPVLDAVHRQRRNEPPGLQD